MSLIDASICGAIGFGPDEIQSQLNHLDKLEEYYKLSSSYKTKFAQFDSSIDFKGEITFLRKAIATLPTLIDKISSITTAINGITVPVIDKTSSELVSELGYLQSLHDSAVKYQALETKIKNVYSQLTDIDLIDLDFFENKITNNEKEAQDLQNEVAILKQTLKDAEEYKSYKAQFDGISIPHSSEAIKQNLEQNQTIYDSLLIQRQQAVYILSLLTNKTELENLQKALMVLAGKQASISKLKALIIDVTNSALQDLVENINNTTNNILEELFDNAMTVELKLYKEMKAKKQTKPYVNMTIYHNGNTYDNINCLSGGESARVSLALTLALSTIFPTPFLCLDECMSSLDMNWREACIEVLRKYVSPRTILDIEHLAIEGAFDDVITLGCC
jgi:DNA repair exonuclease SbcCD ATPase subunit